MSVYQDWQRERDDAVEHLDKAFEHIMKAVDKGDDSPEPPSKEFKRKMRSVAVKVNEIAADIAA